MGGTLDWAAIPFLAELYGVTDLEHFVAHLVAIRAFQTPKPARDDRGDT